jgi:probable phosphoglycerate mutase
MRLFFARHGESEANVQGIFWNQTQGYGLTAVGRGQAEALADRLGGIEFAALLCSPVLRAVETAEIVARRLGLTPVVADGLREWHTGILEGQGYNPETQGLHWQVMEQWMIHGNLEARIEGGESGIEVRDRFMSLVGELEDRYRETDANVLLISHGGTLYAMLPFLAANVDSADALAQSFGYTTLVVTELCGDEWVCRRWGDEVLSGERDVWLGEERSRGQVL